MRRAYDFTAVPQSSWKRRDFPAPLPMRAPAEGHLTAASVSQLQSNHALKALYVEFYLPGCSHLWTGLTHSLPTNQHRAESQMANNTQAPNLLYRLGCTLGPSLTASLDFAVIPAGTRAHISRHGHFPFHFSSGFITCNCVSTCQRL